MLSVLIPVYNFNVVSLVQTLNKQLQDAGIDYEILCLDDCSTDPEILEQNQQVNEFSKTKLITSPINYGRNKTRRILAENAKFDWLLFVDADVIPKSNDFITNYLKLLKSDYDAIYGGFAYHSKPPNTKSTLRWKYGKTCEEIAATKRNQNAYKIIISANNLIRKSVFLKINSKITEKGYGYDNYFGALLKTSNYKIYHLDNEVYHLGIESNGVYLNKVEQSVDNLLKLHKAKKIITSDNDLLNVFLKMKFYRLNSLFAFIHKNFQNQFKRNLLSNIPSIKLLQFYKLSYICFKDLN